MIHVNTILYKCTYDALKEEVLLLPKVSKEENAFVLLLLVELLLVLNESNDDIAEVGLAALPEGGGANSPPLLPGGGANNPPLLPGGGANNPPLGLLVLADETFNKSVVPSSFFFFAMLIFIFSPSFKLKSRNGIVETLAEGALSRSF